MADTPSIKVVENNVDHLKDDMKEVKEILKSHVSDDNDIQHQMSTDIQLIGQQMTVLVAEARETRETVKALDKWHFKMIGYIGGVAGVVGAILWAIKLLGH